ncbi:MAG TPA: hypothetical protein IGS37_14685 [Synechococcales cyanobacterium M55_K2018_004]|nr:hypothetical protein [Synechococcales cyanobacterium M55_K2018_004]
MTFSSVDSLCQNLQGLSLDQKRQVFYWLAAAIATEEAAELVLPPRPNTSVVEQRHYEGKTYQNEKRRCGKAGCRCMEGDIAAVGHGPYWYAYWKDQGKLRHQYIGKRPPWLRSQARATLQTLSE